MPPDASMTLAVYLSLKRNIASIIFWNFLMFDFSCFIIHFWKAVCTKNYAECWITFEHYPPVQGKVEVGEFWQKTMHFRNHCQARDIFPKLNMRHLRNNVYNNIMDLIKCPCSSTRNKIRWYFWAVIFNDTW